MLSVLIPNKGVSREQTDKFIDLVEKELSGVVGQIIVAFDAEGKGKRWAIREALSAATGDAIAFLDADRDIHPKMLRRLIPFLEDYDIVVGSKAVTDSPLHRKIITHLSRLYIRLVFGIKVDTQTGLKLFRREALHSWETNGFAFPIEILKKAKELKLRMVEVPIEVSIKDKMSLKMVIKTFLESIRILLMRG